MRVTRTHLIKSLSALTIFCLLGFISGCASKTRRTSIAAPQASAVTAMQTTPDAPTTFTLLAKGPGGTTEAVAQVAVATPTPAAAVAPTQEKTIKDPAEFAAYKSVTAITDPEQKGDAMLQFLAQYPNTVVKEDMLEGAMAAYQQAGNMVKMQSTALELLQMNPNNLRGLVLLTYLKLRDGKKAYGSRQKAAASASLGEAEQYGQRGLHAVAIAPDDPETQKLKAAVTPIFNEAVGMNALNAGNYSEAQKYLLAAVGSLNMSAQLELVYELATAYLQATPPDAINGSWFGARALNLAPPPEQAEIKNYVMFYYQKYHGSADGFDDILNQTKTTALPPAGFIITPAPPAPSPAELAERALRNTKVQDLSFEDWLFILGSGYQAGADQIWSYLKGKRTDIQGNVISATPAEILLAVSDNGKIAHKPDMTLKLRKPLFAGKVPAPGSVVDYDATFSSYTTNPLMVIVTDAVTHSSPSRTATIQHPKVVKKTK